jgi:extracellular matrix regulatory protein A
VSPLDTELIHVGFDNHLALNRVVAVAAPTSAPMKRMIQRSKQNERAIDLTAGRRTKAVLVLDDDRVALIAITPETFAGRASQVHRPAG